MIRNRTDRHVFVAACALAAGLVTSWQALAQSPPVDAYEWLEERQSKPALDWVQQQTRQALSGIEKRTQFRQLYALALGRAPADPSQTQANPVGSEPAIFTTNGFVDVIVTEGATSRGIWKRTDSQSYFSGAPKWQELLNVDDLGSTEKKKWIIKADPVFRQFDGLDCLPSNPTRCLVGLSDGGQDAIEIREFDTVRRRFVEGGFATREAKQWANWIDENTLLIASDFGPGSLTTAGMPRQVRLWRRGTDLESAPVVAEGSASDIRVEPRVYRSHEGTTALIRQRIGRADDAWWLVRGSQATKLQLPTSARVYEVFRNQLIIGLRDDWQVNGRQIRAGSIIAVPLAGAGVTLDGVAVIVPARDSWSLMIYAPNIFRTRDSLVIGALSNVSGKLLEATELNGRWTVRDKALPDHGTVTIKATDPFADYALVRYHSFVDRGRYFRMESAKDPDLVGRTAGDLDPADYVTEQAFALSRDGSRIPYFTVRRKDMALDGSNPTIVDGYGAFGVARTPFPLSAIEAAWVKDGGVHVVANIRGGGEFGPAWHKAALKFNRQRSYDDFAAVAEDLIRRRITSPQRLGVVGGSNGGLLVGVLMTQRPELVSAVVSLAPVLDMARYTKLPPGSSYVSEYGDPSIPDELAYLLRYSPYHNLRADKRYPPMLLVATRNDDRAHPAHARKMAAKMQALGKEALFIEWDEGGHSAGSNADAQAREEAIISTFFRERLMAPQPGGASAR